MGQIWSVDHNLLTQSMCKQFSRKQFSRFLIFLNSLGLELWKEKLGMCSSLLFSLLLEASGTLQFAPAKLGM